MQESIYKVPKLHRLQLIEGSMVLPFDAVAQCPALRVLELGTNNILESSGAFEETLQRLEKSSLQLLTFQCLFSDHIVRTQSNHSSAPTGAILNLWACQDGTLLQTPVIVPA